MSNVHILHQEVVATHYRGAFGERSTRNGDIFAHRVVVANLANRLLAVEFQVLRLGRYACAGKELIAISNTCTLMNGDTIEQMIVVSEHRIAVYIAKRTYHIIVSQLGFGVNKGHGTDLIHNEMLCFVGQY